MEVHVSVSNTPDGYVGYCNLRGVSSHRRIDNDNAICGRSIMRLKVFSTYDRTPVGQSSETFVDSTPPSWQVVWLTTNACKLSFTRKKW